MTTGFPVMAWERPEGFPEAIPWAVVEPYRDRAAKIVLERAKAVAS